jgi:hypothetical protein
MVVDALIVRLPAEPAVRAMNLLDNLAESAHQAPTLRRLKIVRSHHRRSAGGSQPLREAIAVGRLSCLP